MARDPSQDPPQGYDRDDKMRGETPSTGRGKWVRREGGGKRRRRRRDNRFVSSPGKDEAQELLLRSSERL
jgi:hypothetical protein